MSHKRLNTFVAFIFYKLNTNDFKVSYKLPLYFNRTSNLKAIKPK